MLLSTFFQLDLNCPITEDTAQGSWPCPKTAVCTDVDISSIAVWVPQFLLFTLQVSWLWINNSFFFFFCTKASLKNTWIRLKRERVLFQSQNAIVHPTEYWSGIVPESDSMCRSRTANLTTPDRTYKTQECRALLYYLLTLALPVPNLPDIDAVVPSCCIFQRWAHCAH
jgi:hypothetical protein